jgi:type IV secretion system protein VirD4
MTENITVEKHNPSGSTVKKTERELVVLAILAAGLWHVALVWTTGLPFRDWPATWKALIDTGVGLIAPPGAVTTRAVSPVAVNGHPADQWGWPVTVWAVLVVLLIAAYIGALFGLKALRTRWRKARTGEKGMSTAKGIRTRIEGADGSSLAPAVYVLDGHEIAIRLEDTACTVAPPKWGKTTYMVAGMVADASGAVITTSTRPDVLRLTVGVRKDAGKVYVADFDGLSQYPNKLRWDMVAGCKDPQIASERASAMVNAMPRTGAPSSADRYFDSGCVMIIEALLHAAASKTAARCGTCCAGHRTSPSTNRRTSSGKNPRP